ncbi:hypothetical protein SRHO_G00249510 [Serrasalmus rhombeus]
MLPAIGIDYSILKYSGLDSADVLSGHSAHLVGDMLLEDTKRLEKQLSEKTSLKNSMLHDNQMSTRSLKHWTNSAAFHLQMLIHVAQLEMGKTSRPVRNLNLHVGSISNMAGLYQNFLEKL